MKKLILSFILACCTLAAAAQYDNIKVKSKGAKPTISDFATALITSNIGDEDFCMDESLNAFAQAWKRHKAGKSLMNNEKIVVDEKNGYISYESRYEEELLRVELCYWNESDQKHKLFAYNISCFDKNKYRAGQFDGVNFYRYSNDARKMTSTRNVGYDFPYVADNGVDISYSLPRTGKDITATIWHKKGKKQMTIRWTGKGFTNK